MQSYKIHSDELFSQILYHYRTEIANSSYIWTKEELINDFMKNFNDTTYQRFKGSQNGMDEETTLFIFNYKVEIFYEECMKIITKHNEKLDDKLRKRKRERGVQDTNIEIADTLVEIKNLLEMLVEKGNEIRAAKITRRMENLTI